jgi:AcrR family transcriptional regulator
MSAGDRREVVERAATEVFAERGYRGASMEEIARRSGVTVPVVYDHFASKDDLHRRLIERHYAELREIWFRHAAGDTPLAERVPRAIEAWFAYVEAHPFAGRMLFRNTTGDPRIEAMHREIQRESRAALLPLGAEAGAAAQVDLEDAAAVEMAWEAMRAVLQGLALWWYDHPDVPRERVVASAMNAIWLGFERFLGGEAWLSPPPAPDPATASRRRRRSAPRAGHRPRH